MLVSDMPRGTKHTARVPQGTSVPPTAESRLRQPRGWREARSCIRFKSSHEIILGVYIGFQTLIKVRAYGIPGII